MAESERPWFRWVTEDMVAEEMEAEVTVKAEVVTAAQEMWEEEIVDQCHLRAG